MHCKSGTHYSVVRGLSRWQRSHYWLPDDKLGAPEGDIKLLRCTFCEFEILKRYTRKPPREKGGQGRYNRMRAAMVKHLHAEHRPQLAQIEEA